MPDEHHLRASCAHDHHPLSTGHAADDHDDHEHHHHHLHIARPKQRRALLICILLTGGMMITEFAASFFTGSLMLASDALHMLSHAGSLGVSLGAIYLSQRRSGTAFSFGLYRVEVLAALLNGLSLAVFCAWIIYESCLRIMNPAAILGAEMTVVALIGLAVNLLTAFILFRSGVEDLNTKSAFLHMLADTYSSVAIVLGGIVIVFTQWYVIDPLLSLIVAAMIARWSWGLLRDSTLILLERSPRAISVDLLETELRGIAGVHEIHDLHVWEITSQYVCLSAHVVLDDLPLSATGPLRVTISDRLRERFGISHTALQFEC